VIARTGFTESPCAILALQPSELVCAAEDSVYNRLEPAGRSRFHGC